MTSGLQSFEGSRRNTEVNQRFLKLLRPLLRFELRVSLLMTPVKEKSIGDD